MRFWFSLEGLQGIWWRHFSWQYCLIRPLLSYFVIYFHYFWCIALRWVYVTEKITETGQHRPARGYVNNIRNGLEKCRSHWRTAADRNRKKSSHYDHRRCNWHLTKSLAVMLVKFACTLYERCSAPTVVYNVMGALWILDRLYYMIKQSQTVRIYAIKR